MKVEPTFEIRILASFLILIPASIGLLLHTVLAITLYKGWKTFHKSSFYVITVQLQWCDICALLLDLYLAFPLTLTGYQYMGDSISLYYAPLFFEGIAFNGLFMFSFFMSFNRFLLFILPQLHSRLFTYWGTRIVSGVLWIIVFIYIGLSNHYGCRKEFDKDAFYFWYNCSQWDRNQFHYSDFMRIASNTLPALMILMYVIIYIKIRHTAYGGLRSEVTRVKQEIRYFVQTLLITALIIVEVIAFFMVPNFGVNGYGQLYLNIVMNLIMISNNLISPIVVFAFNSDVRQGLLSILSSRPSTTVQIAPTHH